MKVTDECPSKASPNQARSTRAQVIAEFWAAPDQARFDQIEIAHVLGYSIAWVERARWAGGGPQFVRSGGRNAKAKNGRTQFFGGRVFYVKKDVIAWLEANKPVSSTSEYSGRPMEADAVAKHAAKAAP
jgi:hypothetical protein